jgi:hypothetical protein
MDSRNSTCLDANAVRIVYCISIYTSIMLVEHTPVIILLLQVEPTGSHPRPDGGRARCQTGSPHYNYAIDCLGCPAPSRRGPVGM